MWLMKRASTGHNFGKFNPYLRDARVVVPYK